MVGRYKSRSAESPCLIRSGTSLKHFDEHVNSDF